MRTVATLVAFLPALALGACVRTGPRLRTATPRTEVSSEPRGRSEDEIKAGFERVKTREPYLPMMSQEAAHEAMPKMFKGRSMPTLMLVAGLQPKTFEAVMAVAKSARTEGNLDPTLLNDVFWAVSSANDCFY